MKEWLLWGEVFGDFVRVMLSSETVDELISGAQDFSLHLLLKNLIVLLTMKSGDFFSAGLDDVVETISASLQSVLEEVDLLLVELLLQNGHNQQI
jgi:hypothetical protein